jgi:Holliday junction DNA helicase RuvA
VIEAIRGRLVQVAAGFVVVDLGALTLRLQVPAGVCDALGRLEISAAAPADVHLVTHLIVRPEGWQLFGFRDTSQREIFRVLIGLPGIGPRLALSLLSHLSSAELAAAVEAGDLARIQAVPGIGRRTAARIVTELAGKLQLAADTAAGPPAGSAAADAVDALTALGLPRTEALALVRAVGRGPDAPNDTAGLVRAALGRRARER